MNAPGLYVCSAGCVCQAKSIQMEMQGRIAADRRHLSVCVMLMGGVGNDRTRGVETVIFPMYTRPSR